MDKGKKDKTLTIKLICLLLSLGLWFYITNVENPVRTSELKNIPVELINTDYIANSKFALSENQQFTVDLKLEGPSSDVIKAKKEDFKIVADMSAYALKSGENTIPVQIVNYPENVNIKNNGFLGIKVKLEDLIKKELPVKSKVNLQYKQNIHEKDQTISPANVNVSGPKSSIDKIYEAVITGEEKDINSNIQKSYDIKFLDASGNEIKGIQTDHDKAQLTVTITNGKNVPITLKTIGTLPDGYFLDGSELSRNTVNITGSIEDLDKIKSIETQPVDISNITSTKEINTKLNLPENVSVQQGDDDVRVKINIRHDASITKTITANVQYTGLSDTLTIEESTSTVNVTLSGAKSMLDNITASNIHVAMDLSNVTNEGTFEYTPTVTITNADNVTISNVENVSITVKKKV